MGDLGYSVETTHEFTSVASKHHGRSHVFDQPDTVDIDYDIDELYVGLSIIKSEEVQIGFALHDGTYSVDFAVQKLCLIQRLSEDEEQQTLTDFIVRNLDEYRHKHCCKFLGAGVTVELHQALPGLCARLWSELDIVPIVLKGTSGMNGDAETETVDELADSVARKCVSVFGPTKQPRIAASYLGEVQVDVAGRAQLTTRSDYQQSVREPTWRALQKYVKDVKSRNIRVAFFSATPQGGGVALMRHALVRFLRHEDINVEWYVPKPRPDIFRITKTNHNILQGVVDPEVRSTDEQLQSIKAWIADNAQRYWLKDNGPLRASSEGGAHVIIVDDPQMPQLIPIAKGEEPDRPVIFRSHIEVRDDLVKQEGSAAQQVWKSLWEDISKADVFISHPVKSFVPSDVDPKKLAWMPATTDWLDGLNKDMQDWDVKYYLHTFRQMCRTQGLPLLAFPKRPYITQIARFDPSKGIPDLLRSYARLREMMEGSDMASPQLVICGHASVDDPDGTKVYDETTSAISDKYSQYKDDIIVARLGPSDQLLDTIMSMAKIALQLSTREGFEVKVSEALHKGKPIIATDTGGIPLQVEHGKNGFLVPRGDYEAVAKHLYDLFTDDQLYESMSSYARHNVSDEVHTVGNALSWLYLVSSVAGGKKLEPSGSWVNDLARDAANEPYGENEPRLPRHLST